MDTSKPPSKSSKIPGWSGGGGGGNIVLDLHLIQEGGP